MMMPSAAVTTRPVTQPGMPKAYSKLTAMLLDWIPGARMV
jgi:hypothetical protein